MSLGTQENSAIQKLSIIITLHLSVLTHMLHVLSSDQNNFGLDRFSARYCTFSPLKKFLFNVSSARYSFLASTHICLSEDLCVRLYWRSSDGANFDNHSTLY